MFGIEEFIAGTIDFIPALFDAAFTIVAAASAITALTPTPDDDRFVGRVYRVIETLALNIGYAKDRPRIKGGRFVPN